MQGELGRCMRDQLEDHVGIEADALGAVAQLDLEHAPAAADDHDRVVSDAR